MTSVEYPVPLVIYHGVKKRSGHVMGWGGTSPGSSGTTPAGQGLMPG